jgi:hypothetical protein
VRPGATRADRGEAEPAEVPHARHRRNPRRSRRGGGQRADRTGERSAACPLVACSRGRSMADDHALTWGGRGSRTCPVGRAAAARPGV